MALIIQAFLGTVLFLSVRGQQQRSPTENQIDTQRLSLLLTSLLQNAARLSYPITTRINDAIGVIGRSNQDRQSNYYNSYERYPYTSGSRGINRNSGSRNNLRADVSHGTHHRRISDGRRQSYQPPVYDYDYEYDYDYDYGPGRYPLRDNSDYHYHSPGVIESEGRTRPGIKSITTIPIKINEEKRTRARNNAVDVGKPIHHPKLPNLDNGAVPLNRNDPSNVQPKVIYVVVNPGDTSPSNAVDLINSQGLKINADGASKTADGIYIVPAEAVSGGPRLSPVKVTQPLSNSMGIAPVTGISADSKPKIN